MVNFPSYGEMKSNFGTRSTSADEYGHSGLDNGNIESFISCFSP
jgi:hypothetical protein